MWIVFYFMVGAAGVFSVGPFPDRASCMAVADQIQHEFKPKRIACIHAAHMGEQPKPQQ